TSANSYIAFSTAPGGLARDDSDKGRNGLFTSYLLGTLTKPGFTIEQVFNTVRKNVYQASQGEQLPLTSSRLLEDVYFPPPKPTQTDAGRTTRHLSRILSASPATPRCLVLRPKLAEASGDELMGKDRHAQSPLRVDSPLAVTERSCA